jgi:hypothetical protein
MTNDKLVTEVSDSLLQQLRDYLDQEADLVAVGSDPAQAYEANRPLVLLRELDRATSGELLARHRSNAQ